MGAETQELWGNHLLTKREKKPQKTQWEGSLQKETEADKKGKAERSLALFSPILIPPGAGCPSCVGVHKSQAPRCTLLTQTRLSSGTTSQGHNDDNG